jgi:RNA polymerase sigma-32 factor
LEEIRRFKLLDRSEEIALVNRYKLTGDKEAAQRLITSNLRLVVKIAGEFQSHWLNNLQDLIQEGNVGLMQALKKFDPGRGVKFSSYASYWIKAFILKYIIDNWRLVRIGTTQGKKKLFYNLRRERDRLIQEGLEPAPALVAERLGVSKKEAEEMEVRLLRGGETSLDAPIGADGVTTQVSLLQSPDDTAENILSNSQTRVMVAEKLVRFRETLTEREAVILDRRLLTETPITLQELGEEFGVSRERVRQLEDRVKRSMRKFFTNAMPDLDFKELPTLDAADE